MWIWKISLQNIRGFENEMIEFSRGINVLVGPNNSGKSTIAQAALLLQQPFQFNASHVRSGASQGDVRIHLNDTKGYFDADGPPPVELYFSINKSGGSSSQLSSRSGSRSPGQQIVSREPNNFIYPYLSKRKVGGFNEQINEQRSLAVMNNLENLYAKVDKVSNPEMPAYSSYVAACKEILGFIVTCSSSPNGKKACYIIDNFESISLDNMGEGVASILGLLVDLCVADNKLFVIEEPENDIHPKALKELLRLIVEKSKNNQFIITTHSNIVTRFLGAEPEAKIFKVDMTFKNKVPTAKVELIANDPESRRDLLEELGYELADSDLWEGWLFLEEATAETFIKNYLIPWFVPSLQTKLRTFSARTIDEVRAKFDDFNILFSYLSLQPTYKNRAWVITDGGSKEKEIIDKLKVTYGAKGWKEEHFQQFDKHDFENYYPEQFKDKVAEVLSTTDKKGKMDKKNVLRHEVETWIKDDPEKAKAAFQISAANVIDKLRSIKAQMS